MAVSIDQVDVESRSDSTPSNGAPAEPPKPDPREIERALNARRERLARVHAH
jgi:hypothetical protein